MKMSPYLNFKGDCESAFRFYAQCLGGQVAEIFRYGGSPMADHVPGEWHDKVMHGSVTVAGQVLMGADPPPQRYEAPTGFSISLHLTSVPEAERIFNELAAGGRVVMPLAETFWAARFGELVDRFGIPWSVNCEAAQS